MEPSMAHVIAGSMTYARVSTDEYIHGIVRAYTGQGDLTNDPLDTFGNRAVVYTPDYKNYWHIYAKAVLNTMLP